MVQIGACIPKAEALDAGRQILRFCFEVNGRVTPILLDRPDIIPAGQVPCPDGLVEVRNGSVVFVPTSGASQTIHDPGRLAAALATIADYLSTKPDPDEVARVLSCVPAWVPPDVAREVTTWLLRRFTVEERTL